jgi:signal peptidase I
MRSSAPFALALPRRWRVAPAHLRKALGWALALLLLLVWAQYLRPQSFGGRAGYILVSGQSMEPRYHTGDLVFVLKRPSYHRGEVVAYRVPKGDPMAGAQVIHRIVGGDAVHGFVVQGDNRTAPDVWRPKLADVVGAEVLRLPDAVVVLQYLRSPVLLALLAACFVFVHVFTSGTAESAPGRDAAGADDPA